MKIRKKIKKNFLIAAFGASFAFANAQQEIQNSFYMFNSSVLNPAYAGSRGVPSAVIDYRNQWAGWKGAPNTANLIIHTPLMKDAIGVGLNVVQEKIGPTTKTAIFADFAYRMKLNKKGDKLCFGLRSGADLVRNSLGSLEINDRTDPLSANNPNFNTNTFNVGAGVYYYGKRYYAGLTIPKMIPNQLSKDAYFAASKEVKHFYFIGGYVWKLNSMWDMKPAICAKYTASAPVSVDANLSFLFNEKIWFGIMYRYGAAAGANIMYHFNKQLRVGYSYDYTLTNMRRYSPSTHEVIIGYDFIKKGETPKATGYF